MSRTTPADALSDWMDIEAAARVLAQTLGLVPNDSAMWEPERVHWSNTPLGNELVVLLDRLVQLGFLEKRDEPALQYRVRSDFRATLDTRKAWNKRPSPGLDLVVLRCRDLELSKAFYELLGLSFKAEQHGSGPAHYSTRLGETVLELYPAADPLTPIRLGISISDLEKTVASVAALGDFVLSFHRERSPSRALIRDPNGNKIELTEIVNSARRQEKRDLR